VDSQRIGQRSSQAWKWCLGIGAIASTGYFALPGTATKDIAYSVIGIASVIAIIIGGRKWAPSLKWAWYMMAAGGACFVMGDAMNNYYQLVLHTTIPSPSVADAFYLMGYPFIFMSVLRLTRQNRSANAEGIIDATIIMLAGLALSWHFLISSYIGEHDISMAARLVYVAYPLMDIALLYVIFSRLVFAGTTRIYHRWIAASMVAMLAGDVIFDLLQLHSSYTTGNIVDGLFLVEYVLIAVAALHPSYAQSDPEDSPTPQNQHDSIESVSANGAVEKPQINKLQLIVASVAVLVPPVLLLTGYAIGASVNTPVLLSITIIALLLVFLRVMLMMGQLSKQNIDIANYAHTLEETHTRRDELEAALRRQAFYDDLTGLPNRALFKDRVAQELGKAQRSGKSVALCFGDLDGFATVNNTLGHARGDSVLIQAATMLSSIVRPGDTVARLGGDEFVVLMTDVENRASALDFAQRIVKALHQSIEVEHNRFELSISVGVALSTPQSTAEDIVAQADAAMYEAKDAGKNCVMAFEPEMQYKLVRRLEITNGFRGALDRNEFTLQYQPIYTLDGEVLDGFEALVRWNHPTIGALPPYEFIDLAEESGFIVPLGRHIFDQACQRAARWNRNVPQPLTVWVNLSRRQLTEPDLVIQIEAAMARHGALPHQIGLEVTENALISDPSQAASILNRLRRLGLKIAVDDFGTGYSSLGHLRQYPVDVLKIDRSFVKGLTDSDPASIALTQTIVQLAQNLHLDIVAEGIEDTTQRRALLEMGCTLGQGYLFSHPLDPAVADKLVANSDPVIQKANLSIDA
jgi:diguanylate cyclase (GGDEF)-like protein